MSEHGLWIEVNWKVWRFVLCVGFEPLRNVAVMIGPFQVGFDWRKAAGK